MSKQQQAAFAVFDEMKPGQVIVIAEFAKRDPAAFKQYGMDYIDGGGDMEFSNDYSRLRKLSNIADYKKL